jgi:flagellar M-ring protein FliF
MDIEDVVIVDSNGKKLTKNRRDPLVTLTADQMDFRQKLEEDMEHRIEGILGPIVGDGRVVARVTAELDFNQVNETQTTYDADGAAIHSTQKDDQSMEGSRPGPYGPAGAQSNQPEAQGANSGNIRTDTKKVRETVNYDVPSTVRKIRKEVGTVKKLSVAVVVDGKITKTNENGKVLSKSEAWTPERLKEFEALVASTVGFDKSRGDSLEIKHMDFSHENFEEAQRVMQEAERRSYLQNMIAYAVIGMVVVLFFLFVVRPYIKWVTENTIDSVDTFLPQTIEELERLQKNQTLPGLEEAVPQLPDKVDPEKVEGEMLREKVTTLIEANPHKAALVLRDWLKEGRGSAKTVDTGGKRSA